MKNVSTQALPRIILFLFHSSAMSQQSSRLQPQQQQPQQSPNPMDPQPFYISQPDPPPQRRTWGQPQPIHFAHQHGPGGMDWPQQPARRAQWGNCF